MADFVEIKIPRRINTKTGRRALSGKDLSEAQARWLEEWKNTTDLDADMIHKLVYEIQTGPFEWPGTRVAEGSGKLMGIVMYELAHEWRQEGINFTGGQLYREAKIRLNERIRRRAEASEIDDPWATEYSLTEKQRRRLRG